MTWIRLDAAGLRARHGMTGTLPAYRHRGLARLVKLASIRWLAEHGVTALFTDNDTENRDMLALNEHLGFRPLTVFALWAREAAPATLAAT
jgi:GNAT superfamily N-acetyltransferase